MPTAELGPRSNKGLLVLDCNRFKGDTCLNERRLSDCVVICLTRLDLFYTTLLSSSGDELANTS